MTQQPTKLERLMKNFLVAAEDKIASNAAFAAEFRTLASGRPQEEMDEYKQRVADSPPGDILGAIWIATRATMFRDVVMRMDNGLAHMMFFINQSAENEHERHWMMNRMEIVLPAAHAPLSAADRQGPPIDLKGRKGYAERFTDLVEKKRETDKAFRTAFNKCTKRTERKRFEEYKADIGLAITMEERFNARANYVIHLMDAVARMENGAAHVTAFINQATDDPLDRRMLELMRQKPRGPGGHLKGV